jgi:DNA-dependent RNA polymerase auxiliary subunit epsilon
MEKTQLKNILTKIGEVNPEYTLDKQVYNNGELIQFIENPSEEVQLAAVKENGYSIQFIENPSEKVQLAAVKENPYSIHYIENPSERVQSNTYKIHPKRFN